MKENERYGEIARAEGSWSTQQLAEFLQLISSLEDEATALNRGVERVAAVLDAEVAVLLRAGEVAAAVGFGPIGPSSSEVSAVVDGRSTTIRVEGIGRCPRDRGRARGGAASDRGRPSP